MLKVCDIDWSHQKYIRAGFIPYVQQGNTVFYAFGLDNNIGYLCDFGGHRESFDCDALDTAIREYAEEALHVFGVLTRELLQQCQILETEIPGTSSVNIEILLPVSGPLYQYTTAFANKRVDIHHEIQNIVWLSKSQLLHAIDNQQTTSTGIKIYHMYDKIVNVLQVHRSLIFNHKIIGTISPMKSECL